MIITLILISLIIGGVAGFKLGSLHTARINSTLRDQLILQERFSRTWASEATEKYALSGQIASQQTANLGATINTVIQLLSSYQFQNAGNINQVQNERVSELIAKAKSISGLHE